MADETAVAAPPSGGFPALGGTDTKSLIRQIMGQAGKADAQMAAGEKEMAESRTREAAARATQAQALGPKREQLKQTLQQAPAMPELKETPAAPPNPQIDPKEMGETLSLITALAAMGGALTRAPLTAALNNFSAGVHGMVQGNQKVFENNIKLFKTNLEKSNAENQTIWKKYQAAKDKHGTDIQALQSELQIIAAETQNPIDMELAKRGDVVSLMKLQETRNNNYTKALEQVAKISETTQRHAQLAGQHQQTLAEQQRHNKEMEGVAKTGAAARTRDAETRAAKLTAPKELKGKAADSFVHNAANIEALGDVLAKMEETPGAFGFKTLIPGMFLNRMDTEGVPVRAGLANISSMTMKDRAGTAQTASEMKNLAPFIPRDGDDEKTVKTKIEGMIGEMERMNKFLSAGAAPGARPATVSGPTAGTVQDGYRFKGGDPAVEGNWEKI